MCCGQSTLDYLAHLVGTHNFDLDRAKSVVGSESTKRGSGEKDKVITVGGVPITLPDEGTGDHIHIHLNIGGDGGNEDHAKGILRSSGKSPISPQKSPTLPKGKDSIEMTVSVSPSGLVTRADDSGTKPKDENSVSPQDEDDDDDDDVTALKVCPAKNQLKEEAKVGRVKEKIEDSVMPSKALVLSDTDLDKNVEKMLKCPHLQTLVEDREVHHTCKVCGEEVTNSKEEINGHVSSVHGINALQYLALFFPQGKWFEVSAKIPVCADSLALPPYIY